MNKKRVFYTIVFFIANLVDFLRTTQNGDIWSAAANCTGLVVFLLIAKAYQKREIWTPFAYIWTCICGICALILILSGKQRIFDIYIWAMEAAIFNIWWLVLYSKCLLHKIIVEKSLTIHLNFTSILWILMTFFMMLSYSGKVWPLWFLWMFGIFYLTKYYPEDFNAMINGMIDGTILSFFLIQIYAYGFRPFDQLRYVGAFPNSNVTALHYLIVYVMFLFKLHYLHTHGANRLWKTMCFLGACGLLGFLFLTMGRTAWVASALITFLYGLFVMHDYWKMKWNRILCIALVFGMSTLLVFPTVFASVRWFPTILHHPIWYDGEYSIDKVHSFDPANSEKYIELDEFLDAALGRIIRTFIVKSESPFILKAKAAELTDSVTGYEIVKKEGTEHMDESIRIRLTIYKTYLRDMTLFGHSEKDGHYQIEGTDYFSWHAQNVWLQIAYYYGIPSGILFIILTVVLFLTNFGTMKKYHGNQFAMIPFFICVLYFTYGTMELVWNTGQLVLFLLFFVQHPKIFKEEQALTSQYNL